MELDFLGGTAPGRSRAADTRRVMNMYPEINNSGGKTQIQLVGRPGLKLFATGSNGSCRGMFSTAGGKLFVVIGNDLFEVSTGAVLTNIGELKTSNGTCTFAESVSQTTGKNQIVILDGTYGYEYSISDGTFTNITDSNFEPGTHVVYVASYFVKNMTGTNGFQISDSYTGLSWQGLGKFYAEGNADNVVALLEVNKEILVFGTESIEVWYPTGVSASPFAPVSNVFINIGTAAQYSVAKIDDTAFWLGSSSQGNVVYMIRGNQPQRISTHSIEYAIGQMDNVGDCVAYTYQQEGHHFYVMNFITGNRTLVYDQTTGLWHERGYYSKSKGLNDLDRASFSAFWDEKIMVGDRSSSNIYELDLDYYTDNGEEIRRFVQSPHIHQDRKRILFKSFELDLESGIGNNDVSYV